MYARIHNVIAQSEMQLTMWQETFKAIGAKLNMQNGAKQITVTIALEADDNALVKRLLERGKSSGRTDDQDELKIRNRFEE